MIWGHHDDILVYFSNIWETKSRLERNALRHQLWDYWNDFFYDYSYDMYNLLGNLLSGTGYNLDLHDPLIIRTRLDIAPQLQLKDTKMLCLEGCDLNGDHKWATCIKT